MRAWQLLRTRWKTGLIVGLMLYFLLPIGVAISQGAGIFIRTDCTTITAPVSGASLCFQTGIPPKFYYWNGAAWAHWGMEDTVGTATVLDTLNEIAPVATQGQQAVVVSIPPSVTLDATLVPVVATVASPGASDWHEGFAFFIDADGNEQTTLTYPLDPTTDPTILPIVSMAPVRHIGVKVKTYNSGSASTTMIATAMSPWRRTVGPQFTNLGSGITRAQEVAISHALAVYGHTRTASALHDDTNDVTQISGSGAGQVRFSVPAGATGTFVIEASDDSPAVWFSVPLIFDTGTASSFPARGHVLNTGHRDYRIRFSSLSAGSTTAFLLVSPGSGLVRAYLEAGTNLFGQVAGVTTALTTNGASTCYITSAASTNATNCKNAAGNVYGVRAINTTATIYYLRMYNLSASPTCSSATGFVETIPVPAGTSGSGIAIAQAPQAYATGIGFCLTGGGSSTDNTNAATGVYLTILYK